jgi:DNA polymerase-3 subunit epsilon
MIMAVPGRANPPCRSGAVVSAIVLASLRTRLDKGERSFDNLGREVAPVADSPALAFVDVETTGLSPNQHRVAEIGVVTVDGERVERWTTFVRTPQRHRELDSVIEARPRCERDDAPTFADIAGDLAVRLTGRLFIAHNARFDYAFLRAEFDRVGVAFAPQVVCSVMLSRALYPDFAHHNLDALAQSHHLTVEERHRALPDAELLWQWWRAVQRGHPRRIIRRAIVKLLAGPTLPAHFDPSLIDRLPPKPGAYVLHAAGGEPLVVGAAANLRLHVLNYFRIDRATVRALEHAHRVTDVTWHVTSGILGARLEAAALDSTYFAGARRRLDAPLFTWRLVPDSVPCVALASLASAANDLDATYGLFATERKARNALSRLAEQHRLSRSLLGLDGENDAVRAHGDITTMPAGTIVATKKDLLRIFDALRTLKVAGWPHDGPIGIRERSALHVVDRWRFLGTARNEGDLHALLDAHPHQFDPRIFRLLQRTLPGVPRRRLVDLSSQAGRSLRSAVRDESPAG